MKPASLATLQAMPIFGGIRLDVLQLLLQRSTNICLSAGDYFFRERDQAGSLFVLEHGRVAILKEWEGKEYLLAHMGPGDCFGEMALMDLSPRSASARAEQGCVALELRTSNLFEIYKQDLEQFTLIQMNLGREVSRRLRLADERLFRFRIGAPPTDLTADPIHST